MILTFNYKISLIRGNPSGCNVHCFISRKSHIYVDFQIMLC